MYNEDTQDHAAAIMVSKGFSMGRMVYPITDAITPNAIVSTVEDGPFWYGDLADGDVAGLMEVANQLKKDLEVQSQTSSKFYVVSASI